MLILYCVPNIESAISPKNIGAFYWEHIMTLFLMQKNWNNIFYLAEDIC